MPLAASHEAGVFRGNVIINLSVKRIADRMQSTTRHWHTKWKCLVKVSACKKQSSQVRAADACLEDPILPLGFDAVWGLQFWASPALPD